MSDTTSPSTAKIHPVLELLKHRYETSSKPNARKDPYKLALCIEGGGMRGAIAAGMVASLRYIGLRDTFDVIYGSSAGSIVGAYFLADQVPQFGPKIYYDVITAPHKRNIPFIHLLSLIFKKRPVLLLDRLVDDVMCKNAPLDWKKFKQRYQIQKLIPVATDLTNVDNITSHAFDNRETLKELLEAVRASARVPGITGDVVKLNNSDDGKQKIYGDALLSEAIPYRTAIEKGKATHVLVLRTRPHDTATKKPGVYEHLIAPGSLRKSGDVEHVIEYLKNGKHIQTHMNDVRILQKGDQGDLYKGASIMCIVPETKSISQLESNPRKVFQAVRHGFVVAYHSLSPFAGDNKDKAESVAKLVFDDDEIERVEKQHKHDRKRYKQVRKRAKRIAMVKSQQKSQSSQSMNTKKKKKKKNIGVVLNILLMPFSICRCLFKSKSPIFTPPSTPTSPVVDTHSSA